VCIAQGKEVKPERGRRKTFERVVVCMLVYMTVLEIGGGGSFFSILWYTTFIAVCVC